MMKKKEKIAVAMSGGVDSSVSAYILKNEGYEVAGLFMRLWSGATSNAKKMAKFMDIPFVEIKSEKIFKESVINYFIEEYRNLRTPNPCVMCNKLIKFGWLLEAARKKGFSKIATGHYVRIKKDKNGVYHLLKGKDITKDQSYFLYRLNQSQLKRIIFPLGEMTKEKTKAIAEKENLPLGNQKESQEICFLEGANYRDFLKRKLPKTYWKQGDIVNVQGEIIGRHNGLVNYTIGQRKGIEQTEKNENRSSLFVIGFKKEKNELIVGTDKDIFQKETLIENISWTSSWAKDVALKNKSLEAKIRYRHNLASCAIKPISKNRLKVIFQKPQRAVTPGQSLVIYKKDEVLGGGIIT